MDPIIIKFEEFEGPMDLLIDLIKKRELDIHNLPMSIITRDFINSIEQMKQKNIEITSVFTDMASLLLEIKTKMLLPSTKEDPRKALALEIEKYEKYKSDLEKMKDLQFIEQKYFKRTKRDVVKKPKKGSIADVLNSFNAIMKKKKLQERNMKLEELSKKLAESKFTIEQQMDFLKSYPSNKIDVSQLFDSLNELEEMVVTFSALLELVKIQFFKVESENEKVFLSKIVLNSE
ncbi:segregation/condensation protein A [Bacillus mexicanus]|uniref:segregation and condensation protein A n=1 Tax=Bacillus mexicanus TaxID=2834415 RepID=UPI003D1CEBED